MSDMPVKNTFIHFNDDDSLGRRKKKRTGSEPAPEVRGGGDGSTGSAAASAGERRAQESPEEPSLSQSSTGLSGTLEGMALAAGRIRWADQEDDEDVRQAEGTASASAASAAVPSEDSESQRPSGSKKRSRSRGRSEMSSGRSGSRGGGPNVLDEEQRHAKRKNFILEWKASEGYRKLKYRREHGDEAALQAPATPDPDDKNIGKRKWENLTMVWRQAVREFGRTPDQTGDEEAW